MHGITAILTRGKKAREIRLMVAEVANDCRPLLVGLAADADVQVGDQVKLPGMTGMKITRPAFAAVKDGIRWWIAGERPKTAA